MALSHPSILNWGFGIDQDNRYINFKKTSLGTQLTATLNIGSYSLGNLLVEVARAMNVTDPTNTYTATVDRSIGGGLQNRVTISTNGAFLSLLFGSGTQAAASPSTLLGYTQTDKTGATSYTGQATAGEQLITVYPGFTFVAQEESQLVFGSVNIAADGSKEALVWQIQQFPEVDFKYEPQAKVRAAWQSFFRWAIQQQPFEFTPDYTDYNTVYPVTLETTDQNGQGLGFKMSEMLPNFPGLYETGRLKFRVVISASQFIA